MGLRDIFRSHHTSDASDKCLSDDSSQSSYCQEVLAGWDEDLHRVAFVFGGTVQGVGFRFSVQRCAVAHKVCGWVKNESDGTVSCEMQGSSYQIEAVLRELAQNERDGRAWHRMTIESRVELDPINEGTFSIRY